MGLPLRPPRTCRAFASIIGAHTHPKHILPTDPHGWRLQMHDRALWKHCDTFGITCGLSVRENAGAEGARSDEGLGTLSAAGFHQSAGVATVW